MRTHRRLDVTLTLLGPILTRGGQSAPPGIDAPLARDPFGRPMLPYSLVKGKVVDALRELRPGDRRVGDWLGLPSGDAGGSYDPDRGRVRFSDFVTDQQGTTPDGVVERIEIDRATGAAAGRMLAMVESPFGYGEPVRFAGRVEFIADDAEAEEVRTAVEEAMRFVPAYGALRTVGFGRTHAVEVTPAAVTPTAAGTPAVADTLTARLVLDRPLCLVGKKHSRNHFESLDSVPGSVLKGAVARLLLELAGTPGARGAAGDPPPGFRFPLTWTYLDRVRFAEARPIRVRHDDRPVEDPRRPVVPPLSTVFAGEARYDVALLDGPTLVGGRAPAFAPDWKYAQEEAVRAAFGWAGPPRERRTRTAIDADTGRAADQQLFSYGLVLPEAPGVAFVWEADIGLHAVPPGDRPAVRAELAELLAFGLPNVGKTRAVAKVVWLDQPTPPAVGPAAVPGGLHVVTLQTEFLMTDPDTLRAAGKSLRDGYAEFWAEAAGGALVLERHFARQSLHGGYLSRRFGRREGYEPYLVTDRGSTFVLRAKDLSAATARLSGWRDRGLPLPGWVAGRYGGPGRPLWQTCPFLPEVGFGEVSVDLACHTATRPPEATR